MRILISSNSQSVLDISIYKLRRHMLILIIEIRYERGIKKILRCEHKKACGCSMVEGKLSDHTTKARICKVRLFISQRVIEL